MVTSALRLAKWRIKFNTIELLLWIKWILKQSSSHKPWFDFCLPWDLHVGYYNISFVGSFGKTIFKNRKNEKLYEQALFHELYIKAILFSISTLASFRFDKHLQFKIHQFDGNSIFNYINLNFCNTTIWIGFIIHHLKKISRKLYAWNYRVQREIFGVTIFRPQIKYYRILLESDKLNQMDFNSFNNSFCKRSLWFLNPVTFVSLYLKLSLSSLVRAFDWESRSANDFVQRSSYFSLPLSVASPHWLHGWLWLQRGNWMGSSYSHRARGCNQSFQSYSHEGTPLLQKSLFNGEKVPEEKKYTHFCFNQAWDYLWKPNNCKLLPKLLQWQFYKWISLSHQKRCGQGNVERN